MALPLDTSGVTLTNKIVNELHSVSTLEQRYIIPNKGTFFVNKLKVINDANGQLLEPVIDYMVLQLSIEASNEVLKETSQLIYIKNPQVLRVRLTYQAVGTEKYENIHARVTPYITDFINGRIDNKIFNAVAGENIELLPRDFLSTPHVQNSGASIYTQLSNIAEAISTNDPSAMQAAYEFLINYTNSVRGEYTKKITDLRNRIDSIFKSTELVNGQYIFTHEDLNPFVYFNYGSWVSNPRMLFWGGPEADVVFGEMKNISNDPGLLAVKTMAYRRDDSAPGINYVLTANKSEVNEGGDVTFTLSAPGLAEGTRISYMLAGVRSSDVVGGALSGAFILNASSVATVTITLVEDNETDGDTNLVLRLVQSPDVFALVKVVDTSQEIKFEAFFSSDVNGIRSIQAADEGQTAYLQIRTAGLITDRNLFLLYDDSTVNDNDIDGARPNTVVVSGNRATVPFTFKNDFVTEGNETLVINLCTTQNISSRLLRTVLQVNDTSKTPTLTSFFTGSSTSNEAIVNINEGQLLFLKVKTSNMPNGSVVNLTYAGTANADDFLSTLPTSVTLLNNEAVVQYNVKPDGATEGDETFTVTSALDVLPNMQDTKSVTIKDTSVGYMVEAAFLSNSSDGTQPITAATIPTNIYLCVKTRGFNNGDSLYVDMSSADASVKNLLNATTNTIRINANAGSVLLTLDDSRGSYTSVGQLRAIISTYIGNVIGNQMATIDNFPVNPRAVPTAKLTAVNSSGAAITQIGEGVAFRVKIETTNVPNGSDALPVRYSGTTNADDFSAALPSSVVITNGVGWLDFTTKADVKLEGTETFGVTVELPYGGGASTVQISILDTSLPVVNLRWTSDAGGNNTITGINEGQTAYLQVRTSGFTDGTALELGYSGQTNAADFVGTRPATVSIVGGAAVVPFTFAADSTEEGNELFTVSMLYQGTSLNSSASILVNDTSLPGPTTVKWSRSLMTGDAPGNLVFNEGETVFLHIETKNVPAGTELVMTYNGTANGDDFLLGLPNIITTAGTWTTVPFTIAEDMVEEAGANEYLFATASYRSVTATTPSSLSIIDTTSHVLVKNGEVKDVTILPGGKYLLIVQGAGGSSGRGLLTNNGSAPVGGNGNRGTLSKATFRDGASELFNIFAFGGGRGNATAYGLTMSDGNGYVNESGGYVLTNPVVPTIDGISTDGFIPDANNSFAFAGMNSGYVPFIFYTGDDRSSAAGFNHSRGFKLPLTAVTNALWNTYGSGGEPTRDEYGNSGLGGGAGGTYLGIITNPTSRPLTLRLTAGVGGVTDNSTANGGVGLSGGPGQAGCVFITRVANNYSLRNNNAVSSTMVANRYTATQMSGFNGNNYPGNKLTVPPGKKLTATLVSFVPDLNKIPNNDYAEAFGIFILKAENNVFWAYSQNNGNPTCFIYASYSPILPGSMFSSLDERGSVKRLFKRALAKAGGPGLAKNTAFVPYMQGVGIPTEYAHLIVNYPDNDPRRILNGGHPDYGVLAHQFNDVFTTDRALGKGQFWPTIGKFISGANRIHLEVANTTAYDIVLAPLITNSNHLEATLYYNLEDI